MAAAAALAFAAAAQAATPKPAQPEWVGAVVVRVDAQRSRVTLQHERIRSIDMEAMTMPFKTAPGVQLDRFKAGDKVRFTVANQDDHLVVQAMEPLR
jgi:Cu/Ag efflux protein CusF